MGHQIDIERDFEFNLEIPRLMGKPAFDAFIATHMQNYLQAFADTIGSDPTLLDVPIVGGMRLNFHRVFVVPTLDQKHIEIAFSATMTEWKGDHSMWNINVIFKTELDELLNASGGVTQ